MQLAGNVALVTAATVLIEHKVDFVVVGSIARLLRGDVVHPHDLDVLVKGGDANLSRLAAAVGAIGSAGEGHAAQAVALRRAGQARFVTAHGLVDVFVGGVPLAGVRWTDVDGAQVAYWTDFDVDTWIDQRQKST